MGLLKLKHGDDPDENFVPAELARGVEVETEHTDDLDIAKQIAKAHLAEIPNYYTLLDEMERKAKEKAEASVEKEQMGFLAKVKKVCADSYAKDAARYMWFVVHHDGAIDSGWEYREDGLDALRETKETDPQAKLVGRVRMDKAKLAEFFKRAGVSPQMAQKGFRAVRKERMD
jgi:hypothetical protein